MTAEVIYNHGIVSKLDTTPDNVLRGAMAEGLTEVVLIGYDKEGMEYFASSKADGANTLWLLERAKYRLLDIVEKMHGKGR